MKQDIITNQIELIINANNKTEQFFRRRPFLKLFYKITGKYHDRFLMIKLKFHRHEIMKNLK